MSGTHLSSSLISACKHGLQTNLALKSNETVLIVTDAEKRQIGRAFKEAALKITSKIDLLEIPIPKFNGEEPPDYAAEKMLSADVILMPLAKSLSWTQARREATQTGARIGSMPQITEDIILRTFPIDYESIKRRVNKLDDLFDAATKVKVTTKLGTSLEFSVSGRKGRGRNGGIYKSKGAWGNLPCGEAFIAPVEGSVNGLYFIDASHAGVGEIFAPIKVIVENGFAINIEGGPEATILSNMLTAVDDPNAFNIAEFGIGCNDKAKIIGITLEDEKVLGTCHIALGRNLFFGGTVDVGLHVDGVIKSPTIYFDNQKITEEGKLII